MTVIAKYQPYWRYVGDKLLALDNFGREDQTGREILQCGFYDFSASTPKTRFYRSWLSNEVDLYNLVDGNMDYEIVKTWDNTDNALDFGSGNFYFWGAGSYDIIRLVWYPDGNTQQDYNLLDITPWKDGNFHTFKFQLRNWQIRIWMDGIEQTPINTSIDPWTAGSRYRGFNVGISGKPQAKIVSIKYEVNNYRFFWLFDIMAKTSGAGAQVIPDLGQNEATLNQVENFNSLNWSRTNELPSFLNETGYYFEPTTGYYEPLSLDQGGGAVTNNPPTYRGGAGYFAQAISANCIFINQARGVTYNDPGLNNVGAGDFTVGCLVKYTGSLPFNGGRYFFSWDNKIEIWTQFNANVVRFEVGNSLRDIDFTPYKDYPVALILSRSGTTVTAQIFRLGDLSSGATQTFITSEDVSTPNAVYLGCKDGTLSNNLIQTQYCAAFISNRAWTAEERDDFVDQREIPVDSLFCNVFSEGQISTFYNVGTLLGSSSYIGGTPAWQKQDFFHYNLTKGFTRIEG